MNLAIRTGCGGSDCLDAVLLASTPAGRVTWRGGGSGERRGHVFRRLCVPRLEPVSAAGPREEMRHIMASAETTRGDVAAVVVVGIEWHGWL